MKRVYAAAGVVLAAAFLAATLAPVGSPAASGVWNARERGCYCHQQDANPAVGFSVNGFPGRYVPGENYTIVISVTFTDVPAVANRSQGGFYIEASAGTFFVPTAMEGLVQVQGAQATQTSNGSMRRDWTVVWKAPDQAGQSVTFSLFVNTVNGNRSESLGTDHWTSKTVQIGVGDDPIVTGAPAPRPPFALETYGMLVFAVLAAGYAFYVFRTARRPAGKDTPDNRHLRGEEPGKKK